MKVQRYLYGGTNVGQLQSGRSALRSPEEVAAEAAAPYDAVAGAAGAISQDLFKAQERKNEIETKQDATQLATRTALAQSALKKNYEQSKLENRTPEEHDAGAEEIIRSYASDTSMYSERNRNEIAGTLGTNSQLFLAETEIQSMGIKTKQVAQNWQVGVDAALDAKEYDTVKFLADMGLEGGIIDQASHDKIIRTNTSLEEADVLFAEYQEAYENENDAEFMASLSDKEIDEVTMADFFSQKSFFDKQMAGEEQKRKEAEMLYRDQQLVTVRNSMKYAELPDAQSLENFAETYSNENLEKIANKLELPIGQRQSLYDVRDARLKALASKGGGIVPNYGSADYRKSIDDDSLVALGMQGQEAFSEEDQKRVVDWQIDNAQKNVAIGRAATNYINNGTKTITGDVNQEADGFIEVLGMYNRLMGMDGVNLEGLEAEAQNMLEVGRSFYGTTGEGGITDPNAAKRVYIANRAASPKEREAAELTYDSEVMWEALISSEDMSQAAGVSRKDQWLYFDETPTMPDAVKAHMLRVGHSMWIQEALTINGRPDPLKIARMTAAVTGSQSGVTTFNSGVPTGGTMAYTKDGGIERVDLIESEVMMYPVTDKEGEPWAHAQMELDMVGRKIRVNNTEYEIGPRVELDLAEMGLSTGMTPMEVGYRTDFMDTHEYEGNIIPVNHLQAYTPALAQDQYDGFGHRNWMFMFRGNPAAMLDGSPFGWTPYYDDEGNPNPYAPVREGMTDVSGEPQLPRAPRKPTELTPGTGELPSFE